MIILIDQDGTLADFIGGFTEKWAAKYPEKTCISPEHYLSPRVLDHYSDEPREIVESIYSSPGFIFGLSPIEGGIEAVKEMAGIGYDVRICTAPLGLYKNCIVEKYAWVEKYLGQEFVKKVIMTKDKTLIKGDVLIDDSFQKGMLIPSWEHMVFDRPYNRDLSGIRLNGWKNWKDALHLLRDVYPQKS